MKQKRERNPVIGIKMLRNVANLGSTKRGKTAWSVSWVNVSGNSCKASWEILSILALIQAYIYTAHIPVHIFKVKSSRQPISILITPNHLFLNA